MIKIDNEFDEVHGIIRSRWIPEILESIRRGNHYYGEIQASIEYISQTELNRKLNLLVDKGALDKKEQANRTRYEMKELGEELHHIFGHLFEVRNKYFKG